MRGTRCVVRSDPGQVVFPPNGRNIRVTANSRKPAATDNGYSRSVCSPLSKLSQSERSDRTCFVRLPKRTQNRSSRSVFARSSWRRGYPYHRSYDAMLFRAEDRPPRRHRCRRRRRRSIFRSTERVTRTGPRLLKRRVSRTLWNALHERTTGGRGERRRAGKTRVTKP